MGKDKNKDKEHQDGETAASSKTITSPQGCLPVQRRPQPGQGSKGCRLSQDNHQSSCKGDGKGSCTVSGSSQQQQKRSCNSN